MDTKSFYARSEDDYLGILLRVPFSVQAYGLPTVLMCMRGRFLRYQFLRDRIVVFGLPEQLRSAQCASKVVREMVELILLADIDSVIARPAVLYYGRDLSADVLGGLYGVELRIATQHELHAATR